MATKIAVSMVDGPLESEIVKSASDPTVDANPSDGLGTVWANTTTGELYTCTDATTDANVWTNVGGGSGNLQSNTMPGMPDDNFVSSLTMNTSNYNHIFVGGTDTGSSNSDIAGAVTHYVVDQISNAALTVADSEVAAGSAHVFTTGSVGSDTNVTFRVRSKDNEGGFSADRIISLTVNAFTGAVASGGSVSTQGNYKVHTFTTSGTFTVTDAGSEGTVEHLTVAGGGGGGHHNRGGGGGAGGYLASTTPITTTSYNIVVGAGGTVQGTGWGMSTSNGTDSVFSTHTSVGGGRGGGGGAGFSGGSGGGAGQDTGGAKAIAQGTAGQGNNGGQSMWQAPIGTTGGGGGAGAVGGDATGTVSGNGGVGVANDISGASTFYAGGGGGGTHNQGTQGSGGNGGGGIGSRGANTDSPFVQSTAGAANTGGGGGGSGYGQSGGTGNASNGGSGVVIIRYQFQ